MRSVGIKPISLVLLVHLLIITLQEAVEPALTSRIQPGPAHTEMLWCSLSADSGAGTARPRAAVALITTGKEENRASMASSPTNTHTPSIHVNHATPNDAPIKRHPRKYENQSCMTTHLDYQEEGTAKISITEQTGLARIRLTSTAARDARSYS